MALKSIRFNIVPKRSIKKCFAYVRCDISIKTRIFVVFNSFHLLSVKRQDEAADEADNNKNVTDRAPGLGGTNIRFPSK